jgi:hypothetical protein
MNNGEEHCQFVSSRGILQSCFVHPRNPGKYTGTFPHEEYPPEWSDSLRPGSSVYVCTWAMRDFVTNVFPQLQRTCPPFVLVTGDADEIAPTDIFQTSAEAAEFLNSPRILAWFAQNCVAKHPKLVPIPIGLDYHTIAAGSIPWWGAKRSPVEQEAELMQLRHTNVAIAEPYQAYSNFHFNMSSRFSRERQAAITQIPRQCVYYESQRTSRLESWRRQRLYHRFVLSPPGNGLDCHRTWEALCLGCIPIVRASPLDSLWEGLSVWVVNSWAEVTEQSMIQKAAEMDHRVARGSPEIPEKLLLKTWLNRIQQAGAAAT